MNIITSAPILDNRGGKSIELNNIASKPKGKRKQKHSHCDCGSSSFIGAASPKSEVMEFQDWLDAKHAGWVGGKNLNKGAGYGTFGPATSAAKNKWGNEFDAYKLASSPLSKGASSSSVPSRFTPLATKPKEEKPKEPGFFEKAAGAVAGIFGGGAQDTAQTPSVTDTNLPPEKKKMGTGTIVVIAVGSAALLGVLIYLGTRKN